MSELLKHLTNQPKTLKVDFVIAELLKLKEAGKTELNYTYYMNPELWTPVLKITIPMEFTP